MVIVCCTLFTYTCLLNVLDDLCLFCLLFISTCDVLVSFVMLVAFVLVVCVVYVLFAFRGFGNFLWIALRLFVY